MESNFEGKIELDGLKNDRVKKRDALLWVLRFGWIRADVLGKFLWPAIPSQDIMGMNLVKKLLAKGLLIARPLPSWAGISYVLSETGAKLLQQEIATDPTFAEKVKATTNLKVRSGKDLGSFEETKEGTKWKANLHWKHDLWTQQVLADVWQWKPTGEIPPDVWQRRLKQYPRPGFVVQKIVTQSEIHKSVTNLNKAPGGKVADGLFQTMTAASWLEVENAKKSGEPKTKMAKAAAHILTKNADPICGMRVTEFHLAYPTDSKNSKSHKINHNETFLAALEKELSSEGIEKEVTVKFLSFQENRCSAVNFKRIKKTIKPTFIPIPDWLTEDQKQVILRMGWYGNSVPRYSDSDEVPSARKLWKDFGEQLVDLTIRNGCLEKAEDTEGNRVIRLTEVGEKLLRALHAEKLPAPP